MNESTTAHEPGWATLAQLKAEARNSALLRQRLTRSKTKRDALVRIAADNGASTKSIADAAQLTQARVRQIVAKGDA